MDKNLKARLITGRPIPFQNKFIYQPKIFELIDIGLIDLEEMYLPFQLTKQALCINKEIEDLFIEIKIFDLFFKEQFGGKELIINVIRMCQLLFRTNKIDIKDNEKNVLPYLIVDDDLIINRDNFDNLSILVRHIFSLSQIVEFEKKEKKKEYNNPLIKSITDMWKPYDEEKEKMDKKKQDNLIMDMLNYVSLEDKQINYDKVLNLTLFQLLNTQEAFTLESYYNNQLDLLKTGMVAKDDLDLEHWVDKMTFWKNKDD